MSVYIIYKLEDLITLETYVQQGNSVARDLPPTGSEANITNNFFVLHPPLLPGKFCFLKMLEIA